MDKVNKYLKESMKNDAAAAIRLQKQRNKVKLASGDTEAIVKDLTSKASNAISDLIMYLENFGNMADANQIDKLGIKIVSIGHKAARKTKR